MSNIIVGNLTLTSAYAPKVNFKYEYYRSETNIIIGGKRNITISGVVSVGDSQASYPASNVMIQLKNIRDIGRSGSCINVVIPNIYVGRARIDNINIEQGSDPTWVNQGAFSISLNAPLDSIPSNPYGITARDYVKSFSFSEKIDIGEDGHGFIYNSDSSLSKAYVKFSCRISVEVDPICDTLSTKGLLDKIVRKFIKVSPSHPMLSRYSGWRAFLADRSCNVSLNSAEFSTTSILLSPNSRSQAAYVDLNFEHRKTYAKLEESKVVSGSIKGLVSIPWDDIISLSSGSISSKLASAENTLNYISSVYNNITKWDGIEYELTKYANPIANTLSVCAGLAGGQSTDTNKDCLRPSSTSVARNRVDGSIDFNFEWLNTDCRSNAALTIEYQVDDVKEQPTIVEHIIPTVGIILQDLNCWTGRKLTFTSTINLPENAASCGTAALPCQQEGSLNAYIQQYFLMKGLNPFDFLLIDFNHTVTNRTDTLRQSFISVCNTTLS